MEELRRAYCDTIHGTGRSVLAFVDGLDEFAGDHTELVHRFETLVDRTGMKMCVASPPESNLITAMRKDPEVKMQDLISPTIEALIDTMVDVKRHDLKTPFAPSLREEVKERAEGVILWARLVVSELIEGCILGMSAEQLENIVEDLPQEMTEMYQRILDNMPSARKLEAALILLLLCEARVFIELAGLFGAFMFELEDVDLSTQYLQELDEQGFETWIRELFGTIINIMKPETETGGRGETWVEVIHETLQSYLLRCNWVKEQLPPSFYQRFPDSLWLRLCALAIEDVSGALDIKEPPPLLLHFDPRAERGELDDHLERHNFPKYQRQRFLFFWYALFYLPILAMEHEQEQCSSYSIVANVLKSETASPFVARSPEQPYSALLLHEDVVLKEPPSTPDDIFLSDFKNRALISLEATFAILYDLPRYLEDYVSTTPYLSVEEKECMLDFAFHNFCSDDIDYNKRDEFEVLTVAVKLPGGMQRKHICQTLRCYATKSWATKEENWFLFQKLLQGMP